MIEDNQTEEPIIYVGTIADYADVIEKYRNGEYDYDEYVKHFNARANSLRQKELKETKQNEIDTINKMRQINKELLTNK